MKEEKSEGENAEALCETGGPFGDAEERKADGHCPVWDRSFFEIADAVFVERDPVVKGEHFAAGFGVGAVGVVEERWMEETGDEDGEPEEEDCEIGRPVAAGGEGHARTGIETGLDGVGLRAADIFKKFSMARGCVSMSATEWQRFGLRTSLPRMDRREIPLCASR